VGQRKRKVKAVQNWERNKHAFRTGGVGGGGCVCGNGDTSDHGLAQTAHSARGRGRKDASAGGARWLGGGEDRKRE